MLGWPRCGGTRIRFKKIYSAFFRLFRLLRPLALAQSHARAAAVLVDEFDAGTLEGFTDSLNRLTRYWPSGPFKITILSDASAGTRHVIVFVLNR